MAFGDNGLIKYAEEARDKTANSTITEAEEMNKLVDEYANVLAEDGESDNRYDIFVYLYDDGTLSFGTENEPVEGKTVKKEYGNIKGQEYSDWTDENDNFVSDTPWFNERTSITKVIIVDTIVPTTMKFWFYSCENLIEIENIDKINTSEVESMQSMFNGCSELTNLYLTSFNTENVTNMNSIFANCSSLTEIQGLEKFNTSQVIDMRAMFAFCNSLKILNLSSFDTSNVTNMNNMFAACSNLTEIQGLEKFNTSQVIDMGAMFASCNSLTSIDLSSFDTGDVKNMEAMFAGCSNLIAIYAGDNWDLANVENTNNMFGGCGTSTTTHK